MDGEKAEYKNEYHRRKCASQDKKSIERIQANLEILVQLVEMLGLGIGKALSSLITVPLEIRGWVNIS